ncbi:uncharacterized protein VTP21DRAFT_2526 [Calcarisporiella thermophila]|uniref:uncharacterized protein n=1 Tax=Calcarisporiella thermophila TaxID=911321 RepID=UPI0037432FC8
MKYITIALFLFATSYVACASIRQEVPHIGASAHLRQYYKRRLPPKNSPPPESPSSEPEWTPDDVKIEKLDDSIRVEWGDPKKIPQYLAKSIDSILSVAGGTVGSVGGPAGSAFGAGAGAALGIQIKKWAGIDKNKNWTDEDYINLAISSIPVGAGSQVAQKAAGQQIVKQLDQELIKSTGKSLSQIGERVGKSTIKQTLDTLKAENRQVYKQVIKEIGSEAAKEIDPQIEKQVYDEIVEAGEQACKRSGGIALDKRGNCIGTNPRPQRNPSNRGPNGESSAPNSESSAPNSESSASNSESSTSNSESNGQASNNENGKPRPKLPGGPTKSEDLPSSGPPKEGPPPPYPGREQGMDIEDINPRPPDYETSQEITRGQNLEEFADSFTRVRRPNRPRPPSDSSANLPSSESEEDIDAIVAEFNRQRDQANSSPRVSNGDRPGTSGVQREGPRT